MPKLNEVELHQLVSIESKKKDLADTIDQAINDLTTVRANERIWWKVLVRKYHLNEKKRHHIYIDGEILEERRMEKYGRKIF